MDADGHEGGRLLWRLERRCYSGGIGFATEVGGCRRRRRRKAVVEVGAAVICGVNGEEGFDVGCRDGDESERFVGGGYVVVTR